MSLKEKIESILENPRESLSIELKDWIDPTTTDGKLKILKAAIAMRNNDGGIFVIGVKNDGKMNTKDTPSNIEQLFNIDDIQGLITKHSSESFEIDLYIHERHGEQIVAIAVPPGVKTPVATKRPLVENGRNIVEQDAVFVRSLNSNNTPSTTKATHKDWARITEKCFENREADIGRFLRRHLANIPHIKKLFDLIDETEPDEKETKERQLKSFIGESFLRFESVITEKNLKIPDHGAMEVAAIINGVLKSYSANRGFLNLILSSNPDYTGWPIWVDSRNFSEKASKPYVYRQFWEALIAEFNSNWHDILDFWRISPKGRFYLYRALQDDIGGSKVEHTRLKTFDFGLTVLRVAEAIAVAIAFAKALGANEESSVHFAIRWTKLKNRSLSSWAQPGRHLSISRNAHQSECISFIEVPVNVPKTALYSYVHEANKNVFELFDGFELSDGVTEDLVSKLLEKKI
jgi:hypothetical protein